MDAGGVLCSSTQAVTSAGASNGDELLRVESPSSLVRMSVPVQG